MRAKQKALRCPRTICCLPSGRQTQHSVVTALQPQVTLRVPDDPAVTGYEFLGRSVQSAPKVLRRTRKLLGAKQASSWEQAPRFSCGPAGRSKARRQARRLTRSTQPSRNREPQLLDCCLGSVTAPGASCSVAGIVVVGAADGGDSASVRRRLRQRSQASTTNR